ncbi:putative regulatory protein, FmdB family [Spongiibacter sp. IMCC21906]|nr:putative regulatory protein, FmdB family [Spongiibacter sp. IMCC21906]
MPVYDYKCKDHGLFHELASMEAAHLPCACPKCGVPSARVIMIPPEVLAMAPNKRQAAAKNEAAIHAPRRSTLDTRAEAADRKLYAAKKGGCGCSHDAESGNPDRSSLRQKAIYLADGSKVFPSQRPWMISH